MKNNKVVSWFELQIKKMKPIGPIKAFFLKKFFPEFYIGGIFR